MFQYFFVETTHFVDEVKKIEKEIEAVEPVENVEQSGKIREHLNQFHNDVCHHPTDDLTTDVLLVTSYLTPNVRVNSDGKRAGLMLKFFMIWLNIENPCGTIDAFEVADHIIIVWKRPSCPFNIDHSDTHV